MMPAGMATSRMMTSLRCARLVRTPVDAAGTTPEPYSRMLRFQRSPRSTPMSRETAWTRRSVRKIARNIGGPNPDP